MLLGKDTHLISLLAGKKLLDRVGVTAEKQGCISALEGNQQSLKELFYFNGWGERFARRAVSRYGLQSFDSHGVPPTKCFYHERFEDAGCAAIGGVLPVLLRLAHVDSGGGDVGSPVDDGVLSGRDDADIESDAPTVDPPFHENVRRS